MTTVLFTTVTGKPIHPKGFLPAVLALLRSEHSANIYGVR